MGINYVPALILISSLLWLDVPFVRQSEQGCGAATIAMVMQYWSAKGHRVNSSATDAIQIMQQLYSEEAGGIRANDVRRYLTEHEFQTFVFSGDLSDIRNHIEKGRPLITALETNGNPGKFHYLVVVGIDEEQKLVLVNDPSERKLFKMTMDDFEARRRATDHWTLLALPEK